MLFDICLQFCMSRLFKVDVGFERDFGVVPATLGKNVGYRHEQTFQRNP